MTNHISTAMEVSAFVVTGCNCFCPRSERIEYFEIHAGTFLLVSKRASSNKRREQKLIFNYLY
jgi:hypothetical protein